MSYKPKVRDFPMRKSTMMSFAYCQRYFYFQFIAKAKKDKSVRMPLAEQGTDFHEASSTFYDKVKLWKDPEIEYYRTLLPYDTAIDDCYDKFARFEVNRMKQILDLNFEPKDYFMPLANEVFVELPEQNMFGTIDRVWKSYSGYPIIQDVKPRNRKSRTSLRRELAFYIYIANEYPPLADKFGPFEHFSGYFYRDGEFWVEKCKKRTMTAMFGWLDKIDYEICTRNHIDDWPRNTYALCLGCPFRTPCYLESEFKMPEIPTLKKIRLRDEKLQQVEGWEVKKPAKKPDESEGWSKVKKK